MTIHEIKLEEKVYYIRYYTAMPEICDMVVNSFEYKVTKEGTEVTKINGADVDKWEAIEFFGTKEDAKKKALKLIKENYKYQLEFLEAS
jgi:hypothetical protein